MNKAYTWIVLFSTSLFLTGCFESSKDEPSTEDLRNNLMLKLPSVVTVEDLEIEVSQNTGSSVDPVINSRFKGELKVTEALYTRTGYLMDKEIIKEIAKVGTEYKVYGVTKSKRNFDIWDINFEKLDIAPKINGNPISKWGVDKYVIAGSDEERQLRKQYQDKLDQEEKEKKAKIAERERLEKERQLVAQQEIEKEERRIKEDIKKLTKRWTGTYICRYKGRVKFEVALSTVGDSLTGMFKYNDSDGTAGIYEVSGFMKPNREFQLNANRWIKKPTDYYMVGLEGRMNSDGTIISGKVLGNYCEGFEASPK